MAERKIPERRCIGCMQSYPKKDLLRIASDPEKGIFFDVNGRAPGRGCYICRKSECLALALKKNAVSRNLKIHAGREECEKLVPLLDEILKQTSTREVF